MQNGIDKIKKIQKKDNKRKIKRINKLKDSEIRRLKIKSILDIGFGLLVLSLGNLLIKNGIDISNEEVKVLVSNPSSLGYVLKAFGYTFDGLGIVITAFAGLKAYDRNREIKYIKKTKIKELEI